jgi:hypothetical protein
LGYAVGKQIKKSGTYLPIFAAHKPASVIFEKPKATFENLKTSIN